jgi:branched-chain amino acid transport system substrate-binding protein
VQASIIGKSAKKGRRVGRTLAVAVALGLLAAACGSSSNNSSGATTTSGGGTPANTDPFDIPVLGDLSGPLAANGAAGVAGIQAAIKAFNDAGGADGHKVNLEAAVDAASTAAGATAAATQVVSKNPIAITGQVASVGLAGMVPTLQQAAIPYVSSQSLDSLLLPTPQKWFYTTSSTSDQQAQLEVSGMKALLGGSLSGKKIAFVGLASPSVDVTLAAIKKKIEDEGGSLTATERNATAQISSFSAQAANIAGAKPDGVITVDSTANTVITAKALNDAGYTGPMTSSTGANDDTMLKTVNLPNLFVPRTYNSVQDSKTMSDAATAAGISSDKTNNAFFAQGYTAGLVLAAALKKCGFPCSVAEFEKAADSIGTVDIGDVGFAPLTFSATRHHGVSAVQFFYWNGTKATKKGSPVKVS